MGHRQETNFQAARSPRFAQRASQGKHARCDRHAERSDGGYGNYNARSRTSGNSGFLSNIGRPYTLNSAYEFLKRAGHATSRDAIRDYVAWA